MPREWTQDGLTRLAGFCTPSVSNALELCSKRPATEGFNLDNLTDFTPARPAMAGYAVTATYVASRKPGVGEDENLDLLRAVENSPKPVIVVIRDLDAPDRIIGAPWGECFASVCGALGAVGTITDGAVRDIEEVRATDFHVLARRLCVSHACGHMCGVGEPVEVFGTTVKPGDLIHADQHGFLILPDDVGAELIDAVEHMERCEREYIIDPSREPGYTVDRFESLCGRLFQALNGGELAGAD